MLPRMCDHHRRCFRPVTKGNHVMFQQHLYREAVKKKEGSTRSACPLVVLTFLLHRGWLPSTLLFVFSIFACDHSRKISFKKKLLDHSLVRIAFNLFPVHPFFVWIFFPFIVAFPQSSLNWFDRVLAQHNATDCFSVLRGIPSLCILF